MANDMILHCGGEVATYEQVQEAPLPPETDTYVRVKHIDLIQNVQRVAGTIFHGYELTDQNYALAPGRIELPDGSKETREGQRFFGLLTYRNGETTNEMGMGIAFRNSYDKSMKIGLAIGAKVFICDNMGFSGSVARVELLHTGNVLQKLSEGIVLAVHGSKDRFVEFRKDAEVMKEVSVKRDDAAFGMLGAAYGRGILAPRQFAAAVDEWKKPRYPEWEGRNLWSLYNAGTEALKTSPINKVMENHVRWHELAMEAQDRGDFQMIVEEGLTGDDLVKARIINEVG